MKSWLGCGGFGSSTATLPMPMLSPFAALGLSSPSSVATTMAMGEVGRGGLTGMALPANATSSWLCLPPHSRNCSQSSLSPFS